MSDARSMLVETADRLFTDLSASPDVAFAEVWPELNDAGFAALLLSEDEDGFGGDWGDLFAVVRLAGFRALAAPVGEAALAGWALAGAGLDPVEGLATLAPAVEGAIEGDRFTGSLRGVPWGGEAEVVVATLDGRLLRLSVADAGVTQGFSPAGEPRDRLTFDSAPVQMAVSDIDLLACGAFLRTAQIAGALDAALAASIAYANDRVQFGKPIAKFQTVQQNLAIFAVEAAAVNTAGQAAARAADAGDASFEFAAAKLRANAAAGQGAALAHQVHGAIGFTLEYPLHRLTRRLTGWRSEFGGDRLWAERVGRRVAALGPEGLWHELARRADAA
ncbi:acyl-CoA dehydrogenase family protein [Brevundimonas sp.]|uniref:acyl-CoA dehydrogenase family protein n=1 Tax=Brevundimonas sp. TaxID=1871086 RepID=UPI002AB8B5A5|nr:acyl-CoA dehydrogenase family protein [Brevundimonas sp.]MDZ4363276.1 acyl-CoA dehydrogenase family protein [Brevundimonas sp.]